MQFADAPVAHQFGHAVVDLERPVFRAGLKDFVVLADHFDQRFAFVDGQGRFFALHVLTGLDRQHAHQDVPVVGRRDHDRIDVRASEDFAKVLGGGAVPVAVFLIDLRLRLSHVLTVHVADGDDAGVRLCQVGAEVPADPVAARADETDGDLLTGGHRSPPGPRQRRERTSARPPVLRRWRHP